MYANIQKYKNECLYSLLGTDSDAGKIAQNAIFEKKNKKFALFLINLWRKVVESGGKCVSLNPNSFK